MITRTSQFLTRCTSAEYSNTKKFYTKNEVLAPCTVEKSYEVKELPHFFTLHKIQMTQMPSKGENWRLEGFIKNGSLCSVLEIGTLAKCTDTDDRCA